MIRTLLLCAIIFMGLKSPAKEYPWSQAQILQPDQLVKTLKRDSKEAAPLMLHVGFEPLFKTAHIPGSQYAGLAKEAAGLKKLRSILEKAPRAKEVVLYCGCCAFDKCPNLAPAFIEAVAMGFKNVKILNLPENFNSDWTAKGYPTESSK